MSRLSKFSQVKCDLRNKNAQQVYTQASRILKHMQTSPIRPQLQWLVDELADLENQMRQVLAEEHSPIQLLNRNRLHKDMNRVISALGGGVQAASAGNADLILTTGYEIRRPKTRQGVQPPPVIKRSIKLPQKGCVKLMWNTNLQASTYLIYQEEEGRVDTRKMVKSPTKSTAVIDGLESGKIYRFYVTTFTPAGESGFSNPFMVCEGWL